MRKGGISAKNAKDEKAEKERAEKEAETKRQVELDELRREVIEEQISRDPIRAYVEELEQEKAAVADALEYPLVHGQPEEWSNIPRLVARYCIHTQAHLSAVVSYLKARSQDETSADLRDYAEQEFAAAQETVVAYKTESTDQLQTLFKFNDENRAYEKLIDGDLIKFKSYCDEFKEDTIQDLFRLKEDELHYLKNDNLGLECDNEKRFGEGKQEWAADELQFGDDTNAALEDWVKESQELANSQNRAHAMVPNQHEN